MKKVKMRIFKELNSNTQFLMVGLFNEDGTLNESFTIDNVSEVTIDDKISFDDFITHEKPKIICYN
ncbi:MAG: hypothetical protein ACI4S3_07370 [Candidatus Gastranaerophilaceae bacterium]